MRGSSHIAIACVLSFASACGSDSTPEATSAAGGGGAGTAGQTSNAGGSGGSLAGGASSGGAGAGEETGGGRGGSSAGGNTSAGSGGDAGTGGAGGSGDTGGAGGTSGTGGDGGTASDACSSENGGCGDPSFVTCVSAPDGAAVCQDIDECTTEADDCDALATCANVYGGWMCACPAGYVDSTGSGAICETPGSCWAPNMVWGLTQWGSHAGCP